MGQGLTNTYIMNNLELGRRPYLSFFNLKVVSTSHIKNLPDPLGQYIQYVLASSLLIF